MADRKDQSSAMDTETSSALQLTLKELAHLLIKPSQLTILNESEVGSGGYGQVFFATLDGSTKVAVKQLRITGSQAEGMRIRVAMRLARELRIWAKVKHPNVLKLVGYYLSENYGCAQFVSPYMPNGNITEYMKRTQAGAETRLGFVRDITSGMEYLHSCNPPICHGDLKPANVLVNDAPEAVLCDFGLATFVEDSGDPSGLTTSRSTKGSIRYMSPELLQIADAKHTLKSDVWAWACTTFEVITDCTPYSTALGDGSIVLALTTGTPPASIETLNSLAPKVGPTFRSAIAVLQLLIPECWNIEPNKRPILSDIVKRLQQADLPKSVVDLSPADSPGHEERASGSVDPTAGRATNQHPAESTVNGASDGVERGEMDLETVLSVNGAQIEQELSLAPNGKWLATHWSDFQSRLWNLEDLPTPPVTFSNRPGKFRWSPDSRYLVTLLRDEIRIWSAESQLINSYSIRDIDSVVWFSNGEDLAVWKARCISVMNCKLGQLEMNYKCSTVHPPFSVKDMASIPIDRLGGRKIVVIVGLARKPYGIMEWLLAGISSILFKSTVMIVYDTDTRKVLSRVDIDNILPDYITISRDGEFALMSNGWTLQLWRLRISNGREAYQNPQFTVMYSFGSDIRPHLYETRPVYFGGNRDEWVIFNTDRDIYVWDVQSPEPRHVIKVSEPSSGSGRSVAALVYRVEETGAVVLGTSRVGERRVFIWKWRHQSTK